MTKNVNSVPLHDWVLTKSVETEARPQIAPLTHTQQSTAMLPAGGTIPGREAASSVPDAQINN